MVWGMLIHERSSDSNGTGNGVVSLLGGATKNWIEKRYQLLFIAFCKGCFSQHEVGERVSIWLGSCSPIQSNKQGRMQRQ